DDLIMDGGVEAASLASILLAAKDSVKSDYLVTLSRRGWAADNQLKSEVAPHPARRREGRAGRPPPPACHPSRAGRRPPSPPSPSEDERAAPSWPGPDGSAMLTPVGIRIIDRRPG